MTDLEIDLRGSLAYLSGHLNEKSDLSTLLAAPPPLKLYLEAMIGMNSTGTRTFMRFIKDWGERALELHECPSWFIDLVNVLPNFLGRDLTFKRVVSFFVPYVCKQCALETMQLIKLKEVKTSLRGIAAVPRRCETCMNPLAMKHDPNDFLLFVLHA